MQQLLLAFDRAARLTCRRRLPASGRSPVARECSQRAAQAAAIGRESKTARYLAWLRETGPKSDHQAAAHFAWPLSSVCSIRNNLVDQQLVQESGRKIPGPYGLDVATWAAVLPAGDVTGGRG